MQSQNYATPIEYGLKLEKSPYPNDDKTFRQIIGALLYVARYARPDIAYALNTLSHLQSWVLPQTLTYSKRVIRYLYCTANLSLVYRGDVEADRISVFVDASHAPDVTAKSPGDAYSVTGCLLYFRGNLIDWTSRKQRIIARSSAAAEIIAITDVLDTVRTTN